MNLLNKIWHKISFIGVSPHEIHQKREVVILNKTIFLAVSLVLFFVPFEIFLNGFELVPFEIGASMIFSIVLLFNYWRAYIVAKYLSIFLGIFLIFVSTYAVGGGSNSEFNLLPIMLMPLILFKDIRHILLLTLLVTISFFVLKYSMYVVVPLVAIPIELREKVQPIMNLMTIVFLFAELYYFKNLNEKYEHRLEDQKQQIESNHKEIQDSITYAKRIQTAILPSDALFKKHFPNSFIMYLPKDIVAGDFYWMTEMDGKVFLAAADCTGHGVPGAMVSVVCHGALNRSVREYGLRKPCEILDKTRQLVIDTFEQNEENVKDGMDISLACFDFNNMKLEWAGANNPLYILRHSELKRSESEESGKLENSDSSIPQNDEFSIEITKGDREPIGYTENPTPFTTHQFGLQKGDTVYLFTDGYADQFGGLEGKKIGYKLFRDKLVELSTLEMDQQKIELESFFTSWKGDEEQVDDVCVIGIPV